MSWSRGIYKYQDIDRHYSFQKLDWLICLCCVLQGMFDYLDNTVIKLCDMSTVGTDLGTVKQQIEELKVWIIIYFCHVASI